MRMVMACLCVLLFGNSYGAAAAEAGTNAPVALQEVVNKVVASTLKEFAGKALKSNQLAITLVDLRDPERPVTASFRGREPFYPASVIKLFYLAAAQRWLQDGKLQDSEELHRAMRDMIVDSCNEATHYVLDVMTGTTGGPELPPAEMKAWGEKRNAVNRFFVSVGYTNINANQKPWNEGPYGRERVFVGKNYENRNKLTTEATARLLTEITLGRCISPERSKYMLGLLQRAPFKDKTNDEQATAYTGKGLPPGSKLWSKAGWTSTVRHDAALVELPSGRRFILVTFTGDHSDDPSIIAFVAKQVVAGLQ